MSFSDILPYFLAGGVVVFTAIMAYVQRQRRRKRLEAWAASKGFTYEASAEGFESSFANMAPFNEGHSHRSWHVVRGSHAGVGFVAFQHEHDVGSGKNRTHHVHRVCALQVPIFSPGLRIRRERFVDKLHDALGGEDIDFESDEFSRKFWVKSPNRRFAYDVIHARVMEFLLPLDKCEWAWFGNDLLLMERGKMEPEHVERLLRLSTEMVQLLPRHLHPSSS